MCQPSRCSPKGVDTRQCASKDAGPQRRMDLVAIPHRLKKGTSASEDTGPLRGVDCEIPHTKSVKGCGVGPLRGVDCEIPHWLGRRTKHSL